MTAKDFEGKKILEGDKVLWASALDRSPRFEYRYVRKVEGNRVWTSKTPDGRISLVCDNSKMFVLVSYEELLLEMC